MRIIGSFDDAQDIAQDVFIQAYRHCEELQNHPNPGAWLRTTAKNRSINHIVRYKNRLTSIENTPGSEIQAAGHRDQTEDMYWMHERLDLLKAALLEIPDAFRVPLVLFHYEDSSYEEIAAALNISVAKVKTDIHRGRMLLKKKISAREAPHG